MVGPLSRHCLVTSVRFTECSSDGSGRSGVILSPINGFFLYSTELSLSRLAP